MLKIARVFPSKTTYTPDDDGCYFSDPGLFIDEQVTEAVVSCTFTWDKPKAEQLAESWGQRMRVTIGGPAYDDPGGEFTAGVFLRQGMVLTSRGCPHRCKFCFVPKREGSIRELPIVDGNRVLDSNLFACSRRHVEDVFAMLHRQHGKVGLHGGIDTKLICDWHIDLIAGLRKKLERIYIAHDHESMKESTVHAIRLLRNGSGLSIGQLRCFVLMGFDPSDTPAKAESRCQFVLQQGAVPFASYYRGPDDSKGNVPNDWKIVTRRYAWMPGIFAMAKREKLKVGVVCS